MSYDIEIQKIQVREPWHLDIRVLVNDETTEELSFLENYEILNFDECYNSFREEDYDAVLRQVQRLVKNEGWQWDSDENEFKKVR